MSVYHGDKQAVLYKGDHRPAEWYRGGNKIAGYTDSQKVLPAVWEGTYNDVLTGTVSGNTELRADWQGKNGALSQNGTPTPDTPIAVTANVPAGTYKIACPTGGWWELALADDLRGIGPYLDRLELDVLAGKGKLRRNIIKRVFNGTEAWEGAGSGTSYQRYYLYGLTAAKSDVSQYGLCSHAKNLSAGDAWVGTEIASCVTINNNDTNYRIYRVASIWATLAAWKTYLAAQYAAGTPVTAYYVAAIETVTALTLTHMDTSSATELTFASLGITVQTPDYPFVLHHSGGGVISASDGAGQTAAIVLPELCRVGDAADTLEYTSGGVWTHKQRTRKIDAYAGETVPGSYISSTGALSTGAALLYQLATPVVTQLALGMLKTWPGYTAAALETAGVVPDVVLTARVVDRQ